MQPSSNVLHRQNKAYVIRHLSCVIAIRKFKAILLKMLWAYLMVDAVNTALQLAKNPSTVLVWNIPLTYSSWW